ncbi:MAG: hypothetical protein V8T86_03495 [Victivallis sp.]|uniref:hypothetical protein n=1 Tax=uncultured Victivallis sp. TaxID=354118 RepID=UPI00259A3FE7|nr:hypothetical protein [uncultured Victivallis sp.]
MKIKKSVLLDALKVLGKVVPQPSIRGPADCCCIRSFGQFSGVADGHCANTSRAWFSIQIRADLPPATVASQRSGKARMRGMEKRCNRPPRKTASLRPLQIKLANGVEKTLRTDSITVLFPVQA